MILILMEESTVTVLEMPVLAFSQVVFRQKVLIEEAMKGKRIRGHDSRIRTPTIPEGSSQKFAQLRAKRKVVEESAAVSKFFSTCKITLLRVSMNWE